MSFGITDDGFKTKRLADIKEETTTDWRQAFGDGFDLGESTPEGNIKGILDERISLLWELAEAVSKSYIPSEAEGAQLDNVLALTGNQREGATRSVVDTGVARGTLSTVIPVGTVISVEGNSEAKFETQAAGIISNPAVDEVQDISFSVDPTSGTFILIFDEGNTANINWDDNASQVQSKCETVLGAGNISVAGSITQATGLTLTYIGTLGGQDRALVGVGDNNLDAGGAVTITPTTTTEGTLPFSDPIILAAQETGPIIAPANSLNVIETPVSGMDEFNNIEDAEVGSDIETDQEAKVRREQELQIAGAATLDAIRADLLELEGVTAVVIFQNITSITDMEGRPPHSVDIVVENGDEDEIADRIFSTVAAGIETFGEIEKIVQDSQGFDQKIEFSRPTELPIWVEVDIVKDPLAYPADGDDQVAAAILAYGDALTIGQDVIVFGSRPSLSCSFEAVPGITDFTIRVGTTSSPTTDDNIITTAREIANFDSGRITVTS